MCIVLLTTSHPSYSLIVLNNRDEFILRPTSRPHWWSASHQEILSSRDLLRAEQGTWLGITKTGNFAVLTNYRETDTNDAQHPIQGARSRGAMVTAWLNSPVNESTEQFVLRLLGGGGVNGVGGFSLLCGKLRKRAAHSQELEPLAIISNRTENPDNVPWIAEKRREFHGLSNTSFSDPEVWPKIRIGKEMLLEVVDESTRYRFGEDELVERLYAVLDTNTLPEQAGKDFEDYLHDLKNSIFISAIGNPESTTLKAAELLETSTPEAITCSSSMGKSKAEMFEQKTLYADPSYGLTGMYGTQRQTIILVDWEGNVMFRERSLWDEAGQPIPKGEADVQFRFKIEGWNQE